MTLYELETVKVPITDTNLAVNSYISLGKLLMTIALSNTSITQQ